MGKSRDDGTGVEKLVRFLKAAEAMQKHLAQRLAAIERVLPGLVKDAEQVADSLSEVRKALAEAVGASRNHADLDVDLAVRRRRVIEIEGPGGQLTLDGAP